MAVTPPKQVCEEALRLRQSGLMQPQIMIQLGLSRRQLQQALRSCPNYKGKKERRRWTPERRAVAKEMYASGLSLSRVAAVCGTNTRQLRKFLVECGTRIRPQSEAQTGANNPSWKGGSTIVGGYRYIYCPDHLYRTSQGYVAEHRLVMEKKIGRPLLPEEVVHHQNKDTLDNRPRNLRLFSSNAEHLRYELKGKVPKWSESGQARMREACERRRATSIQSSPTRTLW
jgi:transposase-like protein